MVSPSDGAMSQMMRLQAVKLSSSMCFGIVESQKLKWFEANGLGFFMRSLF
jgi:hypothetical protein